MIGEAPLPSSARFGISTRGSKRRRKVLPGHHRFRFRCCRHHFVGLGDADHFFDRALSDPARAAVMPQRFHALRYCARHGNAAARRLATGRTGHYHDRRSGARYPNRRSDGGDDTGRGAGGGAVALNFFLYRRAGVTEICVTLTLIACHPEPRRR